jgi:hypothetical protein
MIFKKPQIKKAAPRGATFIIMVAGAGFEPATFGL